MFGLLCPLCRRELQFFPRIIASWHSSVTLGEEEVPVIRFPTSRHKEFIKKKKNKKIKGKVIVVPRPGKPLITTNERRLNLYTNEFPTKFEPPKLASQTWTSSKSPGRHFTIHSTKENPSIKHEEAARFEDLNLSERILNAVQRIGIVSPTRIQAKSIPELLKGDNVMIAAETGSGKTHAYLLPMLEKLLKLQAADELQNSSPTSLILTPSKELSNQVSKMLDKLELPVAVGNLDNIWLEKIKKFPTTMHILVSTPVMVLAALRRRLITLENLEFAVIDECDTLLDESFSRYVCNILGRINIRKGISRPLLGEIEAQLILCSATFPKYAEKALEDVISLSDVSAISTGYMHRVSPHVEHKFLRIKSSEKLPTLVSLLQEALGKGEGSVMVFCNKRETVHWLTKELMLHGLNVDRIHNSLDLQERTSSAELLNSGETSILVCTDLSSRGLDTQKVRRVINYDFPGAASDYIHRSGRVGRVGQEDRGRVTNLISKRFEIALVMKIEEAARRREQIVGVNANIKTYHAKRWEKRLATETT